MVVLGLCVNSEEGGQEGADELREREDGGSIEESWHRVGRTFPKEVVWIQV